MRGVVTSMGVKSTALVTALQENISVDDDRNRRELRIIHLEERAHRRIWTLVVSAAETTLWIWARQL